MPIRPATAADLARIAEIEVFNYRLQFYPVFRNDDYYFAELTVPALMQERAEALPQILVYDDGVVKGFLLYAGTEVMKLFVEPVLQGQGIGAALLDYAVRELHADHLWALEKNTRAIAFYARHGFHPNGEKELEEDTDEYLVQLIREVPHAAFD
ncbi:MAG: GNAT family N-acetyltransferase [Clostridia bacterium]|nr:GNAT family N-acetyltransferase [Clostridia bacterium]